MDPRERVIVALDVDNADSALRLAEGLNPHVGAFKVGLELVNAAGIDIFDRLYAAGVRRIFYDAKFHDIPNTVAGAARAAARHRLWMINVHAAGGSRMIGAAARALADSSSTPPILLGVTLLTSLSEEELSDELQIPLEPSEYVVHMARLVRDSGGQGVVASPLEIEAVREACGRDFLIVTPGVRPAGSDTGDQRRTLTPNEAVRRGADFLVIGRPITAADSPSEAAMRIVEEIAQGA
jgi:orotidine-5'-phosphate decarboxylase